MKKNIIKSMASFLLFIAALASILALVTNLPKPTPLSKEEMAEIEKDVAKNTTPIYDGDGTLIGYRFAIWRSPEDNASLSFESRETNHPNVNGRYSHIENSFLLNWDIYKSFLKFEDKNTPTITDGHIGNYQWEFSAGPGKYTLKEKHACPENTRVPWAKYPKEIHPKWDSAWDDKKSR